MLSEGASESYPKELNLIQYQISWFLWLKPTLLTLHYNRLGSRFISSFWFLSVGLLALQTASVALGKKSTNVPWAGLQEHLVCWNFHSPHLLLAPRSVVKPKWDFIAAEDDVSADTETEFDKEPYHELLNERDFLFPFLLKLHPRRKTALPHLLFSPSTPQKKGRYYPALTCYYCYVSILKYIYKTTDVHFFREMIVVS